MYSYNTDSETIDDTVIKTHSQPNIEFVPNLSQIKVEYALISNICMGSPNGECTVDNYRPQPIEPHHDCYKQWDPLPTPTAEMNFVPTHNDNLYRPTEHPNISLPREVAFTFTNSHNTHIRLLAHPLVNFREIFEPNEHL